MTTTSVLHMDAAHLASHTEPRIYSQRAIDHLDELECLKHRVMNDIEKINAIRKRLIWVSGYDTV